MYTLKTYSPYELKGKAQSILGSLNDKAPLARWEVEPSFENQLFTIIGSVVVNGHDFYATVQLHVGQWHVIDEWCDMITIQWANSLTEAIVNWKSPTG